MTKKLLPHEKKNRKPASRACVFCHEKHLQCSNERPCKNCMKRNLGHECRDVVRKRAKYLHTNSKGGQSASQAHKRSRSSISSTVESSALPSPTNNDFSSIDITNQYSTSSNKTEIPRAVTPKSASNVKAATNQQLNNNITTTFPSDQQFPPHNTMLNTTNDVLNKLLLDESNFKDTDSDNMSINNSVSTTGAPNANGRIGSMFSSNYLNQEYLMLGDIILQSKPSSPSPSNTSVSEYNRNTVSPSANLISSASFEDPTQPRKKVMQILKDSRPFISLGFSNEANALPNLNSSNVKLESNEFLDNNITHQPTSQLPIVNPIMHKLEQSSSIATEYVSPLVTHHMYQSVQDIYTNNIMNFDYPQSYHSLTYFLKKRFSGNNLPPEEKAVKRNSLLVILKLIASYRPTFISAHKSLLKPYDLQFLEMTFQRCLIDYEKLSQLNSSPTIIWRRTGEIVSITDDLLSLLGYNLADILSSRTFIMELMYDDESIINYFQLFKSVAVGNLHSSIITKCKLTKTQNKILSEQSGSNHISTELTDHSNDVYIEFCSVWTVKRDMFDLPMLIIGQFLPILPAGDGVRMY
ncbi:zinc finger transcription factor [Scheffersomyces xylosifermentans]|uniref:zinc finger transcription factor n=1 Tax=Scheffersomyces xylosifermentans TaxID=1304137 RepID=UPI00315D99C7